MDELISRQRLLADLKDLVDAWSKYPIMQDQTKGVIVVIEYVEHIPASDDSYKCEQYKAYYDRISTLPDCNDCKKKNKGCQYVPRYGDNTRINCPLWESEN